MVMDANEQMSLQLVPWSHLKEPPTLCNREGPVVEQLHTVPQCKTMIGAPIRPAKGPHHHQYRRCLGPLGKCPACPTYSSSPGRDPFLGRTLSLGLGQHTHLPRPQPVCTSDANTTQHNMHVTDCFSAQT